MLKKSLALALVLLFVSSVSWASSIFGRTPESPAGTPLTVTFMDWVPLEVPSCSNADGVWLYMEAYGDKELDGKLEYFRLFVNYADEALVRRLGIQKLENGGLKVDAPIFIRPPADPTRPLMVGPAGEHPPIEYMKKYNRKQYKAWFIYDSSLIRLSTGRFLIKLDSNVSKYTGTASITQSGVKADEPLKKWLKGKKK